jgi:hypothetical protein
MPSSTWARASSAWATDRLEAPGQQIHLLARLDQPHEGIARRERGDLRRASQRLAGGVATEARLLDAGGDLAATVDRKGDFEAGGGAVDRVGLVGVGGDEPLEGEALLVEEETEDVGRRVGADPALGDRDGRQAVALRLVEARQRGALAGGGRRHLRGPRARPPHRLREVDRGGRRRFGLRRLRRRRPCLRRLSRRRLRQRPGRREHGEGRSDQQPPQPPAALKSHGRPTSPAQSSSSASRARRSSEVTMPATASSRVTSSRW